jgi:6,7-dimethyl-8-ribityllumazine synthase
MSTKPPVFTVAKVTQQVRIGIAAARFNAEVVDELLKGCLKRLKELGLGKEQIEVFRVPGAFELPLTAQTLAQTRRFDAIICLGAVIRGETPHFDYVAGECARGVREVSQAQGLPVIFGVLTTNTEEQAWDRVGGKHGHNGVKAAEAALEMIATLSAIRQRS